MSSCLDLGLVLMLSTQYMSQLQVFNIFIPPYAEDQWLNRISCKYVESRIFVNSMLNLTVLGIVRGKVKLRQIERNLVKD